MGYSHIKPHLIRNFVGIVAETELIKISLHILPADVIIDSIYHTLAEIAPKPFNGVSIGIAINILVFAVVNHFAVVYLPNQRIAAPFICKKRGGTLN